MDRHIWKAHFLLYSVSVNLDTSQSNIRIMWEECLLWYVIRSKRNTAKVGLSSPYLYYRESKPYAKDKVEDEGSTFLLCLYKLYVNDLAEP